MNKKGITLIIAYTVIASVLILTGVIIQRAISESNSAQRNKVYAEAFYLAEGVLARAAHQLAFNEANYITVSDIDPDDPVIINIPDANAALSYFWTDVTSELTGSSGDQQITDPGGITSFLRYYRISATCTHNRYATRVTLNQIIIRRKIYTFQHAVFYQDDLEILPGAAMVFSGKIHCNHDIYLGTHNSLTVNSDYLYSAGSIYNKRKDSTELMSGPVNIKVNGTTNYELMKKTGESSLDCLRADWTDESQNRWQGTVKSSVHGVKSLTAPTVGSIQPDGYYAQNATLKIVDTTAYDINGNPIDFNDNPISTSIFYDAREGKNITVTNIDMAKLNSSGYFPANGLLYATRSDASSTQPNGIRLKNASLVQNNLTVVSNDPVYVQGDYNKDLSGQKKSCAIIADSLNILSNNWSDSTPTSSRTATNTEVNAAFIAGIRTSTSGDYNGGLENYPRLLENWSGRTLKIRGSFVELWNNQIAMGQWRYGMPYYAAPARNWDYDLDFNNSSKLPPFTPFAVEIKKIVWWKA